MNKRENGSIVVSILLITMFLTVIIFSLLVLSNANLVRAKGRVMLLQAQYSAESGGDVAVANLNNVSESYTGSASEVTVLTNSKYRATYSVTVGPGATPKEKLITSIGRVYAPASATTAKYSRKIEVTAQRTTTATSSSMLSRNIVDIDSGVKNIEGKDIYANGYINMNKNTTNLIAENITVAGKNTGSSNCSIGGSGNLVKPTSFSSPGQTKTNIVMAFNNCILPPGNTSNANFNVTANTSVVGKIGSTYIPFSQFMDNSYLNAPGGCTDWTSGAFPRSIPSTGNTKKTHYPDSGSNVAATCGSSGDIALGSGEYTIRDHVHIRANLCVASACSPTFNNPDTGPTSIKFIFVEGTVNFDGIQSKAGSGPIVLVNYGADPASKASTCPLGGSIYLGKNGTTKAPAIYLLSMNGICLDKTKFGSDPALGGVSGKNIYVATNPGSPWDLALDTAFPTDQIPVDLSWRALRYRRL